MSAQGGVTVQINLDTAEAAQALQQFLEQKAKPAWGQLSAGISGAVKAGVSGGLGSFAGELLGGLAGGPIGSAIGGAVGSIADKAIAAGSSPTAVYSAGQSALGSVESIAGTLLSSPELKIKDEVLAAEQRAAQQTAATFEGVAQGGGTLSPAQEKSIAQLHLGQQLNALQGGYVAAQATRVAIDELTKKVGDITDAIVQGFHNARRWEKPTAIPLTTNVQRR